MTKRKTYDQDEVDEVEESDAVEREHYCAHCDKRWVGTSGDCPDCSKE